MISEMKKIYILTIEKYKSKTLTSLRNSGVVHISDKPGEFSLDTIEQKNRLSQFNSILIKLKDIANTDKNFVELSDLSSGEIDEAISLAVKYNDEKNKLIQELQKQEEYAEAMSIWGEFDKGLIETINSKGYNICFAILDKTNRASIVDKYDVIKVKEISKDESIFAIIADRASIPNGVKQLDYSNGDISEIERNIKKINYAIEKIDSFFRKLSLNLSLIEKRRQEIERNVELLNVSDSFNKDSAITYISGFIPIERVNDFKKSVGDTKEMGYCLGDVSEEDEPPTLLKNNFYSSMLKPVIDILGLYPGYRERDISFWFLSFFAIFFALIIGDAVYGLIFALTGAYLVKKSKKLTNTNALLIFLGLTTMVWGVMTGTYLGSERILNWLPFLKKLVIPSITNFPEMFGVPTVYTQNTIMRLCFSIGTLQLSLACFMNVFYKLKQKNISFVADIGWYAIIQSLYFVVLYLLVKGKVESNIIENHSRIIIYLILSGFVLIVVFAGQRPGKSFVSGLKSGLTDLFTTFLNVVSAFGNIMSYIRLFAVGMASVAIAGSFNQIASNFYTNILFIVSAVILVIGHALNLVMGLLSVVVHGVRLNVMEFSNQLGLEWSGYEYCPFK